MQSIIATEKLLVPKKAGPKQSVSVDTLKTKACQGAAAASALSAREWSPLSPEMGQCSFCQR